MNYNWVGRWVTRSKMLITKVQSRGKLQELRNHYSLIYKSSPSTLFKFSTLHFKSASNLPVELSSKLEILRDPLPGAGQGLITWIQQVLLITSKLWTDTEKAEKSFKRH